MTSSSEIDLSSVPVAGRSPSLHGYLAVPDGDGPWPAVVVAFELFGLDDQMRRHADRLAEMGYLALIPDLFSEGGAWRCLRATFRAMSSGQGRAFADLEAARQWLAAHPDCTGKVGCIGFCLGGGFALLAAGRGFDAASVNYGPPPKDLDAAVHGACPIVASYGGRDRGLRGAAERLEAALDRAEIPHDVQEYVTAGHFFLNDAMSGPMVIRPLLRLAQIGPEPASAADAWDRIAAFFEHHLRAAG